VTLVGITSAIGVLAMNIAEMTRAIGAANTDTKEADGMIIVAMHGKDATRTGADATKITSIDANKHSELNLSHCKTSSKQFYIYFSLIQTSF